MKTFVYFWATSSTHTNARTSTHMCMCRHVLPCLPSSLCLHFNFSACRLKVCSSFKAIWMPMRLNQNTFASLSNYEFLSLRSFIRSFWGPSMAIPAVTTPPLHLTPPPLLPWRKKRTQKSHYDFISFKWSARAVGPCQVTVQLGVRPRVRGRLSKRAVGRGAGLQGVVCVACVASRLLLLLLLCCPAIGAAKNQQLDFVSLPLCPQLPSLLLLLLLLSRCCPIVIPACALCCAVSRYPRTGDCSPCAAVDNG